MASGHLLPSTELAPAAPRALLAPAGPTLVEGELDHGRSRALRDALRVLVRYRGLVTAGIGLGVVVASLAAFAAPRRYTAATRLQLARQSPIQLRLEENVLRLDDMDRTAAGVSTFLATQVAVLRSRDLAERVISRHRLANEEAFLRPGAGRLGMVALGGQLLSLFRPRGWVGAPEAVDDEPDAGGAPVPPALLDRYMRALAVQDVRGTDLVEVRFTTPDPALSAFLAGAHAQAYLEANEEARLATNATAKDFLGRQLRDSRAQVERAQAALSAFAAEHPNVAVNQEQQIVVQRISELSSLLTKAEASRIGLETRDEFVTAPNADPLAPFLDRPGIQKLHLALLDLRAERVALAPRLGPNHPQMIPLRQREREVDRQLQSEVAHEKAAIRARHQAARLREASLRRRLEDQEAAALALRDLGARYDLLKGDLQTAQALHDSLLKQQMETAVNAQLTASNVRVVDRPELPGGPASPNVPLLLTMGLVAGAVLGAGAAFLCERLDESLRSEGEVAAVVQGPVLATVPRFTGAPRAGEAPAAPARELVLSDGASAAAEAFRALRSAVLFAAPAAPPRVVLVTSAVPGEGKTVCAVNLAAALAEGGARVLLLDLDLRHPGCHRVLGVENGPGLSTFLSGQAELAGLVRPLAAPALAFVPAGPVPPNPAVLVGSGRLRDGLDAVAHAYDVLVLDAPPVLPVSDAVVLGREADAVLLIVKGHDTPRDLVRQARDRLVQANAKVLGAVVNDVDLEWGALYLYSQYAVAEVAA